mmetsp:Transcript_99545/g.310711  ORF Transcript_99545/g.310711 Transcript_99545/m.310711 type:complete len:261 (-) Transcript_99545:180-962(-)
MHKCTHTCSSGEHLLPSGRGPPQTVQHGHLGVREGETEQVGVLLLVLRGGGLEGQHVAVLEDPLESNLVNAHAMFCSDALDGLVACNVAAVACPSQRGIGLDGDVVGLAEGYGVVVVLEDIVLNLVHCGHHLRRLEKGLKIASPEVADADGLQDPPGVEVLQDFPGLGAVPSWEVDEHQIDVACVQLAKISLNGGPGESAPRDLRGDEDVAAIDAGGRDGFSHSALVAVDQRRVNAAAPEAQPVPDDAAASFGLQASGAD